MTRARKGFALLAALWVSVGLSALALSGLLIARNVELGARNRITLLKEQWEAEGCVERSRAAIDEALANASPGAWGILDRVLATSPATTEARCDVTLMPTGNAVNINSADAEQLEALFRALGMSEARGDSMADALLDWRNGDARPRPNGAGRDWYRAAGRFLPRNGPFGDVRELRRVRGFDATVLPDSVLHSVFTVEPGRILWSHAPLVVLASVPGIGDEALIRIAYQRGEGTGVSTTTDVSASLSPGALTLFNSRWSDIQRLTVNQPDAWILTSRQGGVTLEERLAPAGGRAAIVRRRNTP